MPSSIEQLIGLATKEQALDALFRLLSGYGFPTTSWQSGSIQRTIFEVVAQCLSELRGSAALIARGGINSLSSGDWLTLFSESQYANTRYTGERTQGMVKITDTAGTGPHEIEVGDVVVADYSNGFRYRNVTGGVLTQGSNVTLKFEAESVGIARDVANNTITVLVQGPGGATVSNPGMPTTDTWITRKGADVESDASLRQRNTDKWATLSIGGGPAAAYRYWARAANATVRRVEVDDQNPDGPGTLRVYIAGDQGSLPSTVVAEVQAYIDGEDGVGRKPIGASLTVLSAADAPVVLEGSIYTLPGLQADEATRDAVYAAITAYFATVPIGGYKVGEGSGRVLLGGILAAIFSVHGIVNASLNIDADVFVDPNEVAIPDFPESLTFLAAY